jgi:cystathionine beta-lyase
MTTEFDTPTLEELRGRRSLKWRAYDEDVLPLWVAELDVPLAPPVQHVLREAVERSDTGYASPAPLARAFAGFAGRQWGWTVDPERCWTVGDVMVGVGEALKTLTSPGDGVIVCPPVYAPFFRVVPEHGRVLVQVPLLGDGGLDLAGIDRALRAGARAVVLSNPHNPLGRVWTPPELAALDDVVRRHDALVVSDEIHGPLTLPGATFTPYLAAGDRAAVAVVSASKAFNLAGLKAALVVAGSPHVQTRLATMPEDLRYRAGHLGVLAGTAAYDEGDAWLDALLAHLDKNRQVLGELLATRLPQVRWSPPQASYLAWLDCREVAERPAEVALDRGRVALVEGTEFGAPGAGHARLNFGTTEAVLREGLQRLSAALAPTGSSPVS